MSGVSQREVLAFKAAWCPPCRRNEPILRDMQREGVKITLVDIDRQPGLAEKYAIRSVPTYVILEDGKETQRLHDIWRLLKLKRWLLG